MVLLVVSSERKSRSHPAVPALKTGNCNIAQRREKNQRAEETQQLARGFNK
jgi:hypothetical protein